MELQLGRKYYKVFCILAWIYLMRPSFGSIIKDSVKCTEGSVAADTDDCASYFQCIDDETVHLNCANGSYFEANNEICVVDEFGVCPTSRRLCFDGAIFEDVNDCLSYVKCIHGDLVKQKCPAGSYFNVISKNCLLSRTANCASQEEICLEGELQVDSEGCAGYLECFNGDLVKKKCPIGSYFEPIFKLCQVDENGVCSSSSNDCRDEEVQVDPINCAGYFNCENGKLETKTCPSGTYFEPTYKTCIVDLKGVCVEPPAKCAEGGLVIDPNNCAGYLKCIDGEFVQEKCPGGTYYDSKLETCSVDTEGVCVTIRKRCVEGLREKDTKDCAAYTQCIRGEVEILRCDSGRYFNVTQAECLIDVDEVCGRSAVEYDKDLVQFRYSESTSADLQKTTNRDSTVTDLYTGSSIADLKAYTDSNRHTESTTSDVPLSTESSTSDWQATHLDLQFTTLDRERFIDLYKVYLKTGDENVGNEEHYQYNESTTSSDQKTEGTDADFQSTDSALLELTSQNSCIFDLNGYCVGQSTSCTEGKKQRDINNCAGYLKCIDGVFVEEECPDMTYYDYNSDECLIDVDKLCVKSRVDYDKDFLKFQYSESTTGDLPESTNRDSIVTDFITGSSIADLKGYTDSNRYTESTTSDVPRSTESLTSDWQTTNIDLQFINLDRECLTHSYKMCIKSGDKHYSNEEHHQFYEISTTNSYQKTESPEAELRSTDSALVEFTSQNSCIFDLNEDCVGQSTSCTEGKKQRDINNRAGYLKCIGGVFVEEECPDRTYYDYNLDECLIDVDKVCDKSRVDYIYEDFLKFQYSKSTTGDLPESKNRDSTVTDFTTGSSIADFRGYTDSTSYSESTSYVPLSTERYTSDWQTTDLDLQFSTLDRECLTHLYKVCLKSGEKNYSNGEHYQYNESTTNSDQKTEGTDADFQSTDSALLELTSQNSCIFDLNGDCVGQSTSCTEGKKQRDINNCAGYLKCIDGVFVEEECPERTYYDHNSDECLIDVDKVCVVSTLAYEMDFLKFQYSESTSGYLQETTNTDSTVSTADFSTDSSIADFNRYTDPYTASTTNDVPLSTESSTSGSQTTRADLQSTTLVFNLENSTVSCVYNNTFFIEGIREVDPQDCAGYIECLGGEAKKLKCDSGTYFNVTQRECSIDVNAVCLRLDTTTVVSLETTESTPNFTTTVDPYAKCYDGQRKLDPNNCAGFLKCLDGELHEEMCPSGFFFNSTSKKCLVDIRATCVTNIKFCIEGVREEDPNNCAGYRQCISGVVQNLECPIGQYFNVAERDCLNDVHKACARTEVDHSPDKVLLNDTAPPLTIPDESCILDINGVCVDPFAKCTEGQVKLDPNNCAGYLKCKSGELIEELCPSGFYYDLQLKVCLVDRRGICVTNIQGCDEGALEEDPYDCAGYRLCIGGEVAKLKCPFGSYFNLYLRDCLIDVDKICVRNEYSYFE